jgi:transposase InsO family protein
MQNLGFDVSDQTVGNILREDGEAPAPDRRPRTTWKSFLRAHWDAFAAIDFTTVEVWTRSGLVTFYLLFAMELKTRRVHFAGVTSSPHEAWMKQTARELTSAGDRFLKGKQYLIMDRDTKFSAAFRDELAQADVESVVLPPRSPNLNAHLERFFGSLKAECLGRMIFFGEDMLRRTVREYVQHYHEERNHQGLDNTIIVPGEEVWPHDWSDRMPRASGRCAALLPSSSSVIVRD